MEIKQHPYVIRKLDWDVHIGLAVVMNTLLTICLHRIVNIV